MEQQIENRQDVFSFITAEENNFQVLPVKIFEGYEWSMFKHIKLTTLYKNSQFESGNSDDKPFMNIIRPILNLQYRAEGFDVKDIVLFVEEQKRYYKSFLIKKYHEKWARNNRMDDYIDKVVEAYVDFGGILTKKVNKKMPEVVPWQSIAFCDQTDVMAGPICIKHSFSPDQLQEMKSFGWGDEKNGATISIDDLIEISGSYKVASGTGGTSKTPGKRISIYELHGTLPDVWLEKGNGEYNGEWNKFTRQLQVIGFYQKEDGEKQGVCLYKGRENNMFKFLARTPEVVGRALGTGGAEELFESQVWTNYDAIRIKDLLDAAAKTILQTSDGRIAKRQNLRNLDNLAIIEHDDNRPLTQVPNNPVNIRYFEQALAEWEQHARTTGAADEAIMGEQPPSGTPFKLQELVTREAHSLHEYRKGKIASFFEEIHRDWILPDLVSDINKGKTFISELDLGELQDIADSYVKNKVGDINKERVLSGKNILPKEQLRDKIYKSFMSSNKKFINLIKDELKDIPTNIRINIAGKQKYLAQATDKLVNVLRFMMSTYNPQTGTFAVFDDPRMVKLFQAIIENSGMNPMDFSLIKEGKPMVMSPAVGQAKAVPAGATKPLEGVTPKE